MSSNQELVELQDTLYHSKNPTRRWLHCSRKAWLFDKITEYSPQTAQFSALEVGPGSGIYLPHLAQYYQQLMVVDIEPAYLERAQSLQNKFPHLQVQIDDMTGSSLPSSSFDFILCTEVVEHTLKSAEMIQQMARLLKPGGVLLLSTPQPYSLLELTAKIAFLPGIIQLVRWIYKEPIIKTGHINLMREKVLKQQIQAAQLSIIESHKTGFYIPVLAELTGEWGLSIEQYLARRLYNTVLEGGLWTQYYVLQKEKMKQ